jgi:hypothetical protein
MLKSIEQFGSYVHKKNNKLYTRNVCNTCFYKANREYKKLVKPRVCLECDEKKVYTEFPNYKSIGPTDRRRKVCKVCTSRIEKEKGKYTKRIDKGEVVPVKPNVYISPQQKDLAFELMEVLGFTFSPDTGRWSKEGFKNEDGTFVPIIEKKRSDREKRLKEIEHLDVWDKVIYLKERSFTINQISIDTGVNKTALYKFFHYGQKVQLRN